MKAMTRTYSALRAFVKSLPETLTLADLELEIGRADDDLRDLKETFRLTERSTVADLIPLLRSLKGKPVKLDPTPMEE
jgi:hypothetical protein